MQKDNVFYPNTILTTAASSSLEAVSLPELYDTSYTGHSLNRQFFIQRCVYFSGTAQNRQILPHGSACLPCCRRHGIF